MDRSVAGGVALALLLALPLLAPAAPPAAPAGVFDLPDGPFVAQGMFGAKHAVRADAAWLLLRPVWEERPTGRGVRVAVVDTGIDATHPALRDAVVLWRDFAGDRDGARHATPYDDHGHGTHVAGILAGRGGVQLSPLASYFPFGLRGMAPGVDLIVAKAMRADGRGEDRDVAAAIRWAVDPDGDGDLSDGADVINLSIGIEARGDDLRALDFIGTETRRAVNLAILRGVVVVVSSGNEGGRQVAEPGDIDLVVTVGAVDRNGVPAGFTNHGRGLDLLAPGVLVSAYPRDLDLEDFSQDGYAGLGGTSMAAPVVSGAVALLLESDPALRAAKGTDRDHSRKVAAVEALLKATAAPVDDPRYAGVGELDVYGALAAVDGPPGAVSPKAVATLAVLGALLAWLAVLRPVARRRAARAGAGARAPPPRPGGPAGSAPPESQPARSRYFELVE